MTPHLKESGGIRGAVVVGALLAACGSGGGGEPVADAGGNPNADAGAEADAAVDGGGPPPIAEGSHASIGDAEGMSILDYLESVPYSFPAGGDDTYLGVAGQGGYVVHRLSDGQIVHDFSQAGLPANYGVIAANNSLVSFGPDGYSDRRFNAATDVFGFAQLGLFGANVTDAAPVPRSPVGVHEVWLADNTANAIHRLAPDPAPNGGFTLIEPAAIDAATIGSAGAGVVVSLFSPAGQGPIVGVGEEGATGKLFWVDPASPAGLTVVGDVGAGPRRVRCLRPAGTPCAVSSYLAGELALVDWPNRAAPPTIGATRVSVGGPVGIDLALVDGAPTVVSTGFDDDTLHLTTIGAGLTPSDQQITLNGCPGPGHVVFTPGATHVVVSCHGNGSIQVLALPLP